MSQQILSRNEIEELALNAMQAQAEKLNVRGVACVLYLSDTDNDLKPVFRPVGRIERDPDPTKGPDDHGTNYLAVVWAKVAQMVSILADSGLGTRALKFGENGFRGGLIIRFNEGYFLTAFSGGSEDQDVSIALAGITA